jgi:hypothetical protein
MTTRTHNPITRTFLLAGAALLLSTGSASAASHDAQDLARSLLTGAAGAHVSFPVSAGDTARIDPQIQAQRLLTGAPRTSAVTAPNESRQSAGADASPSDFARRLLAGKAY